MNLLKNLFILVNFSEAEQFHARRRHFPPAIYYANRMFEQPIPKLPKVSSPSLHTTQQNVGSSSAIQKIKNTAIALATQAKYKVMPPAQTSITNVNTNEFQRVSSLFFNHFYT